MSLELKEIWAKAVPPGQGNISTRFDQSKIRGSATDIAGRFLYYLKMECYSSLAIIAVAFISMWDIAILITMMLLPYYWDAFRIMKLMKKVHYEQDTKTYISNLLEAFEGFAKRYSYLIVSILPLYLIIIVVIQWIHFGKVHMTMNLVMVWIAASAIAMGLSWLYYKYFYLKRILALRAMKSDLS